MSISDIIISEITGVGEHYDVKKLVNEGLRDYYMGLYQITAKMENPTPEKVLYILKHSFKVNDDLERKLFSFEIPLYESQERKSYFPFNVFFDYDLNRGRDKDKDKDYGIKVHMALDPNYFYELPILTGLLENYTKKNPKKMSFKIIADADYFETWADFKKYRDKQSGKHITIYFRDEKLASEVVTFLTEYRKKVAQWFYGSDYKDLSKNNFDRAYNLSEILIHPHIGITTRAFKLDEGNYSNLRYDPKRSEIIFKNYFRKFYNTINSLRERSLNFQRGNYQNNR